MAQRKPKRKKSPGRPRPEKYYPENRGERRRIERQKKRKGEKEYKDILIIIIGILIMIAVIFTLNYIARRMHEEQETNTKMNSSL